MGRDVQRERMNELNPCLCYKTRKVSLTEQIFEKFWVTQSRWNQPKKRVENTIVSHTLTEKNKKRMIQ